MERLLIYIFTVMCLVSACVGKKGFGPGEQEWGYVNVRPNASMFWWLYYTTADVKSYYDKPLLIWLQGGPGESSTGYGNFLELGPLDIDLNPRNHTWVKNYNVLFIDNPVGTGFSYVNDTSAFATTNAQIASDLLECMTKFYKQLPKFKPVRAYIITQSYGAKMGAEFALIWYYTQKHGIIESNLKGIGLGSGWISPIDTVMNWAPFLFNAGIIDVRGFGAINAAAQTTKRFVDARNWTKAIKFCVITQAVIISAAHNIDFYNIMEQKNYSSNNLQNMLYHDEDTHLHRYFMPDTIPLDTLITYDIDFYNIMEKKNYSNNSQNIQSYHDEDTHLHRYFMPDTKALEKLMNGPVKQALGLQTEHGKQSKTVFKILKSRIMRPAVHIVERLLNDTNVNVFVYGGHLDLLINIPGIDVWVDNLQWKGTDIWKNETIRKALVAENIVEGYYKRQYKLAMYWILRAGHLIPRDNPAAMKVILEQLTANYNV